MAQTSDVTRRRFISLAALGAAGAAAIQSAGHELLARAEDAPSASDDAFSLAQDAYIWGLPIVCIRWYFEWARENNVPLNRFTGNPYVNVPADNAVGPCMNLLYGCAWLDVSKEPLVLHVPDTGDRYYCVQLIDEFSNDFIYVGRRTTGTKAGQYLIAGPAWKGDVPAGVTKIVSPTNRLFVLTRTLVRGDDDVVAAQQIQRRYGLLPLSEHPRTPAPNLYFLQTIPIPDFSTLSLQFFDQLSAALSSLKLSDEDANQLRRFEKLGIMPGARPSQTTDVALRGALTKAVPAANQRIINAPVTAKVNGWTVNYNVVPVIRDPLLKASANLFGPGTHINLEALYFIADPALRLSGENRYTLRFAAGALPPVDAFWSLTPYEGPQFYIIPNPINRYLIGTVSSGLKYEADGSLEIQLQKDAPSQGTSNWLPIPAGPFHLILRTYQPQLALRNGEYKVPALQKV
jgi:hypothetical protein